MPRRALPVMEKVKHLTGDAEPRTAVFGSGSEYRNWLARNCDRCRHGWDYRTRRTSCALRLALNYGYMTDGEVNTELLAMYGLSGYPMGDCECREERDKHTNHTTQE